MTRSSIGRKGISLADVLVLMLVITICSAALLQAAVLQSEKSNRILCASHLKQMGNALILYSNENKGLFPRTKADAKDPKIRFFTVPNIAKVDSNPQASDPFGKDNTPENNDMTAAMYLLLRTEDLTPDAFLCPTVSGDAARPRRDGSPFQLPGEPLLDFGKQTNFPGPKYLNYSMTNVYPSREAIAKGYKTFITAFDQSFAVAADLNPGNKDFKTLTLNASEKDKLAGNSRNHGGDGQNVLYADGHVEFQSTPFCGADQDNIYTYGPIDNTTGGDGIVGSPVDGKDSVLLPSAIELEEAAKAADAAKK